MPLLISEVITEVTPETVPAASQPLESSTPVTPPEYELMVMLNLARERQARLQID